MIGYNPNLLGYFKVIHFEKPKFKNNMIIKLKDKLIRDVGYTQGTLTKGKSIIAEGIVGTFKEKHTKDISIELSDDMEVLTYTPNNVFTDYKSEYSWKDTKNLILIYPSEKRAKDFIENNRIKYFYNEDCEEKKISDEQEDKIKYLLSNFFEMMDIASVRVFEESYINPVYEYKFFDEIGLVWNKEYRPTDLLNSLSYTINLYLEDPELHHDSITKLLLDALVETNRVRIKRELLILKHRYQSVVNPFFNSLWILNNLHKFEINSGYIYSLKLLIKMLIKLFKVMLFVATIGVCFTKYYPVGIVLAIYISAQSILNYWKTINIEKLFIEDDIVWNKIANEVQKGTIYPKRLSSLIESYIHNSKYNISHNSILDLLNLFNKDKIEVGSYSEIRKDGEYAVIEDIKKSK